MPPRQHRDGPHTGHPIGCRHSAFARAHPHLQWILGYLYDHSTTCTIAAVLYSTVLHQGIHFGRLAVYVGKSEEWVDKTSRKAVIGMAILALMARPVFLGAEVVWGLRALEDGEAGQLERHEGELDHQGDAREHQGGTREREQGGRGHDRGEV